MAQVTITLDADFAFEILEALKRGAEALVTLTLAETDPAKQDSYGNTGQCVSIIGAGLYDVVDEQAPGFQQNLKDWSPTFKAAAIKMQAQLDQLDQPEKGEQPDVPQ